MAATTRKPSPASARKAAAVEAYQKAFGKAPPKGRSAASLERTVGGSRTAPVPAAPSPRPTPRAQVTTVPQRPSMPHDVGRFDAKSPVRVFRGYKSTAVRNATSALPTEAWGKYLDNRFNDRAAAAKVLREHRASLGRGTPSSLGAAVAKGRGAEFAVSRVGKAVERFNPYRPGIVTNPALRMVGSVGVGAIVGMKATEGYLADGLRGAFRESFNTLTFGAGGKAVDKVLGKPSIGQQAEGLFGFETPGQSGARRRAEMINNRPTMGGMKAVAKAEGKPKPEKVKVPGKSKRMARDLAAIGVGIGASFGTGVAIDGLAKGVNAIGRGLVKAAPAIGRLAGSTAVKAVPVLGIAAMGAYRAYEGHKTGGAAGAVKGLASGALSAATFGVSDMASGAFSAANSAFQGMRAANASISSGGPRHVWDDKARAASIAVRQAKAAANQ